MSRTTKKQVKALVRKRGALRTLVCPKCRASDDIVEVDVVPAYAAIRGVYENGEIEWGGGSDVDWNGQRPESNPPEFVCRTCNRVLTAKDLGIKVR